MTIDAKDVIGWVGSAVASALAGLFVPAYFAWLPPPVVVSLLWLTCLALAAWAAWNLRRWRRTAATRPMPMRMLDWRFGGTAVALAVGLVVLGPVALDTTYAYWAVGALTLPKVTVDAEPSAITTSQTTTLTAKLADDSAGGNLCNWAIGAIRRKPDCRILYRPPAGTRGTIHISVDVTNARGVGIGTATFDLPVRYQAELTLSPTDASVFVGDTANWTARLDDRPIPAGQACQWTLDDRTVIDTDAACRARYVARDGDVGTHTIRLAVIGANGMTMASGEARFTVQPVEPVYVEYILDVSKRMARPSGAGGTLLGAVIANLTNTLDQTTGGFTGVQVAGGAANATKVAACDNVRELWPLQPLAPARTELDTRLRALAPGSSDRAPLNKAIRAGFLALGHGAPLNGVNRILTVLTAGPDTCAQTPQTLRAVLDALEAANPDIHLRSLIYDYQLLTMTVGLAFTEADRQMWEKMAPLYRIPDGASIVLLIHDAAEVQRLQVILSRLSSPRHPARIAACRQLIDFAGKGNRKILSIYCERLR